MLEKECRSTNGRRHSWRAIVDCNTTLSLFTSDILKLAVNVSNKEIDRSLVLGIRLFDLRLGKAANPLTNQRLRTADNRNQSGESIRQSENVE